VKEIKAKNYFLMITESKKSPTNNAVVKHKIFIYKEHLEGFQSFYPNPFRLSKSKKRRGYSMIFFRYF